MQVPFYISVRFLYTLSIQGAVALMNSRFGGHKGHRPPGSNIARNSENLYNNMNEESTG
jgi:hypothetical protein